MVEHSTSKGLVIITGATGFIGSHLTEHLISEGYSVRCLVRETSNLKWIKDSGAEITVCSLFDIEALANQFKDADYIVHLAGVVKARNLEGYLKGNVGITKSVLDAAIQADGPLKKIICTSSLAVVGPNKVGHPSDETWDYNPQSYYGKAKVEQEKLCHEYMDKLPISIIRPPSVYGPRDTEIFTVFKAMSQGAFARVGFNHKTLSMIYIDDLIRGIQQVMESEKAKGETYFLSSEEEYDWNQIADAGKKALGKGFLNLRVPHFLVFTVAFIAEKFAGLSGKASTLNVEKAKEIVQESWTCSPKKAMKDLGFSQQISLEEGIQRSVDWYRKEAWIK